MKDDYDRAVHDLMTRMEPLFDGIPRYICALALNRSLAAMLGPANQETREAFVAAQRALWKEMDKICQ